MEKYKILLNCGNATVLKDFFLKTYDRFSCMSTSNFWEDLSAHYNLFKPDAYVCVADAEDAQLLALFKRIKTDPKYADVPLVVLTSEESYKYYNDADPCYTNLIISRPITMDKMADKIVRMFHEIEYSKRREEEERKHILEEMANEAARLSARKHILIVDDDKSILKLLKTALEVDYNVTAMVNGKMAMKYLETKTPDIIFLDYQMPDENGPTVFKKIRAIDGNQNIPIVFLTGVAEREKIAEVLTLKPQGYLLKPIDMEKVHETIKSLIEKDEK